MIDFVDFRVWLCQSAATAETFYVSPSGDDGNAGTSPAAPLRTLPAAQTKVRQALAANLAPSVQVAGGTYELSSALTFGPADSGTAGAPVVWQAAPGAHVILAGGRQLQPTWSPDPSRPGVFTAQIGAGITMDGLFVNGQRQVLARYPNVDPTQPILDGYTTLADVQARARNWKHPELADLRALHCNSWGGAAFKVTGRNADGSLALSWVGDNNRNAACPNPTQPLDPNHVMVENVLEELDAPGEWYYDSTAGTLYYYPPAGTNLATATIQTAEQDELIHIEGTSNTAPAHDITFTGFTFTATHRTLFDHPYEGLQLGDWAVARTGAFYTKNAQDITVTNAVFDQLGGNGVFMDGYNDANVVSNNVLHDDGATDVQTVGSTAAVRDPSTWAHQVTVLDDTTPGPKTQDYPRDITISDNQMSNNGRFEKQSAGVNMSMSQDIKVLGNTIHGNPRSCVNINDGTWGGDLIQDNDIFDCVKETADHGPITSGLAGKCVDDNGDSSANGTRVQLWDCNGGAAQTWTWAGGTLTDNGKCMVTGQGTGNGTLVELWDCNGGTNQQWAPQPDGSLRSVQSGRCLDDPGSTTANGTQLEIWDCNGGANQKWTLP